MGSTGEDINDAFADTFTDVSLSDSQLEQPEADVNGIQSIMWYGISSILNAVIALSIYLIWNHHRVIAGYYEIMLSMNIAYWPVAIGWAAIALFDSDFARSIYKGVISISVLGPFLGNIVGFVWLFINADGSGAWDDWYFWLLWPLFLGYDVGQMLLQFLFIPKILDYVDSSALATKDNE